METAKSLGRHSVRLMNGLLDEHFYAYIIEWCDSPKPSQSGVCYHDATVKYTDTGIEYVAPSPANDIYIRIPHPFPDTVLRDVQRRLLRYYQVSFWGIPDVRCLVSTTLI